MLRPLRGHARAREKAALKCLLPRHCLPVRGKQRTKHPSICWVKGHWSHFLGPLPCPHFRIWSQKKEGAWVVSEPRLPPTPPTPHTHHHYSRQCTGSLRPSQRDALGRGKEMQSKRSLKSHFKLDRVLIMESLWKVVASKFLLKGEDGRLNIEVL